MGVLFFGPGDLGSGGYPIDWGRSPSVSHELISVETSCRNLETQKRSGVRLNKDEETRVDSKTSFL